LPKNEITNVQQFTVLVEASMLPKLTKSANSWHLHRSTHKYTSVRHIQILTFEITHNKNVLLNTFHFLHKVGQITAVTSILVTMNNGEVIRRVLNIFYTILSQTLNQFRPLHW